VFHFGVWFWDAIHFMFWFRFEVCWWAWFFICVHAGIKRTYLKNNLFNNKVYFGIVDDSSGCGCGGGGSGGGSSSGLGGG